MAGDWIKMRVNLVTHPKVLAISERLACHPDYQDWSTMAGFVPALGGTQEAFDRDFQASLRVTRYVTVASLLRFWGYANEHARDEFIATLRVTDIDDIVQVPGFGAALEAVGWVAYDADRRGVALPNFNEFNTAGRERSAGAMSAAERQKAYRERQKASKRDVTRDVTSLQESDRREEKRREEQIPPIPPKGGKPAPVELKSWLASVKAAGEKPIPDGDPVFAYAEEIGLPHEFLHLAWLEFRSRYSQPEAKRYRDWRAVFRKAVRGNWMKLWWQDRDDWSLTTAGVQAQRTHQRDAA